MNTLEAILPAIERIEMELPRTAPRAVQPSLTGNMLFSIETSAVWFEFQSQPDLLKGGYVAWVTADMEERAEDGETLVYAANREEALAYDESN